MSKNPPSRRNTTLRRGFSRAKVQQMFEIRKNFNIKIKFILFFIENYTFKPFYSSLPTQKKRIAS